MLAGGVESHFNLVSRSVSVNRCHERNVEAALEKNVWRAYFIVFFDLDDDINGIVADVKVL